MSKRTRRNFLKALGAGAGAGVLAPVLSKGAGANELLLKEDDVGYAKLADNAFATPTIAGDGGQTSPLTLDVTKTGNGTITVSTYSR